jgi:aerobic-type carbon monoxide dehydrogenase small subunit (CoxS/CutS family)
MPITINVNGTDREVSENGEPSLLHVLRNALGLRGVRFGCGNEDCGACTVLVNGEPFYSCTAKLDAVEGKAIITVEGLEGPEADALREAFLAERAGQCGYCLSGILVSAYALMHRGEPLARAEIQAGLSRHLCRCGSHPSILRAVARALAAMEQQDV